MQNAAAKKNEINELAMMNEEMRMVMKMRMKVSKRKGREKREGGRSLRRSPVDEHYNATERMRSNRNERSGTEKR